MYNLDKVKEDTKMVFKVKPAKYEVYKKQAYPMCKLSKILCKKLCKESLIAEEVKLLELAGYSIEYKETQMVKEPFYTRGVP